jgi:hypothetical protein
VPKKEEVRGLLRVEEEDDGSGLEGNPVNI